MEADLPGGLSAPMPQSNCLASHVANKLWSLLVRSDFSMSEQPCQDMQQKMRIVQIVLNPEKALQSLLCLLYIRCQSRSSCSKA